MKRGCQGEYDIYQDGFVESGGECITTSFADPGEATTGCLSSTNTEPSERL